ncbi:hypothetical protein IT412_02060 [Candidatus Peregrinibacteria bacterium]|nr:hypothetical protein [Candidatus Peregrinibacteria bacterium]
MMESLSFLTILFQLFIGGGVFMSTATPSDIDAMSNNGSQIGSSTIEAPAVVEPAIAESSSPQTAKLAQCLTSKGVKMYGAYWCPHCADQKKIFGDDFKLISYQECDDKGPGGNSQICQDQDIQGYPTWKIPGAKNLEGTQSLEDLAKATNCQY